MDSLKGQRLLDEAVCRDALAVDWSLHEHYLTGTPALGAHAKDPEHDEYASWSAGVESPPWPLS